ncbi:MAG TPA: hydroxyethylthiazole kinase, partial [Paenibacillaceae bacterium]
MQKADIAAMLEKVRAARPLVHNITNVVVTNFTANGLLALGASPVMAYARQEVADMAKLAGALVLNIGSLRAGDEAAFRAAQREARRHGRAVVLDPVGAGFTELRTRLSLALLEGGVTAVRGNGGEILALAGQGA